jgi:hypothetical protein
MKVKGKKDHVQRLKLPVPAIIKHRWYSGVKGLE